MTDKSTKSPFEKAMWKPGQSGNPEGRPKGSKNKLTLIKQALQEGIYEKLEKDFQKVYAVTLEKALDGDVACIKLLWESIMPKVRVNDNAENTPTGGITIVVQGTESPKGKLIEGEVIND